MIRTITKKSKELAIAAMMLCSVWMTAHAEGYTEEYMRITGPAVVGGWYEYRDHNVWMLRENPSLFTAAVYLEGNQEFKFLTGTGWGWDCVQYNAAADPFVFSAGNETATLVHREWTDGNDFKFQVSESGNYLLTVNLEAMQLTATRLEYQEAKLDMFPAFYAVGAHNGWSLAGANPIVMTDPATPHILTGVMTINEGNEFKLASANVDGYWDQWFGVMGTTDGTYDVLHTNEVAENDRKWTAGHTAEYRITMNRASRTISIADNTESVVGTVAASKTAIFASDGNVVICADSDCRAEIFDATGRVVKTAFAAAGERTYVALPTGLYIVRAAGHTRLVNI